MRLIVRAPSNIALIKYMGKIPGSENLPENPSLSLTLNELCTVNEWTLESNFESFEVEFSPDDFANTTSYLRLHYSVQTIAWNDHSRKRFQFHINRCLKELPRIFESHSLPFHSPKGRWKLKSGNTFPTASGIASSASSFAALTLGVAHLCSLENSQRFEALYQSSSKLRQDLAALSRKGSGSSCRSFEGPWVKWDREKASAIESHASVSKVIDFVLLISQSEKSVSSSEAHSRIKTSPLWTGRIERTQMRAQDVSKALMAGDWSIISPTVWQESWEMHSLFHTSQPPFTYWEPQTVRALKIIDKALENNNLSAAVTMDAGPNIHMIVPVNQVDQTRNWIQSNFPDLDFLEDSSGTGAQSCLFK